MCVHAMCLSVYVLTYSLVSVRYMMYILYSFVYGDYGANNRCGHINGRNRPKANPNDEFQTNEQNRIASSIGHRQSNAVAIFSITVITSNADTHNYTRKNTK